jgi:L-amino acid N-acyltransferase YncA
MIETDVEPLVLRDGSRLSVRPIRSLDQAALHDAFRKLSEISLYHRFLSIPQDLGNAELTRLTDLDHKHHEALVAMTGEGELVGVARYICAADQPGTAEVAVTIADEWQRLGLGTALLTRLASLAVAAGVDKFIATCFADNVDMLAIFHDLEGARYRHTGVIAGVVEVELDLPRDGDHTHIKRALQAGAGTFSSARHPALSEPTGGN